MMFRATLALALLCAVPGAFADELARPTVLITGSSRGIGFELAKRLEGTNRVKIIERNPDRARHIAGHA